MKKSAKTTAHIVSRLDEFVEALSVRAMVYVEDQHCPYTEEFDGNDLSATHILVRLGDEPIATMRIRWFADFAKFERICVRAAHRKGDAVRVALDAAFEITRRKGFSRALAHVEAALLPYWERTAQLKRRANRPSMVFSDREYFEVERVLEPHPEKIGLATPALVLLRPEGRWDERGVLDASASRGTKAGMSR